MWFGVISLFPEIFTALEYGITKQALKKNLLTLECWNPREFAEGKHRPVDDAPYGGGPGMVLMAKPLQLAITNAKKAAPQKPCVVHLTPQGKVFNQQAAKDFLAKENILLIAKAIPCKAPQMMNLKLAPCQSPPNNIVVIKFTLV